MVNESLKFSSPDPDCNYLDQIENEEVKDEVLEVFRFDLDISNREKLSNDNPSVPDCVFDIEESQEMADLYVDMFGY